MKRILFFPGFLEDGRTFEPLMPFFQGKYLIEMVHYRPLLDEIQNKTPLIADFAQAIVVEHRITKEDILIGHSFGGWVIAHIQSKMEIKGVLLSSFTQNDRVIGGKLGFTKLGQWIIRKGIFKSWLFHFIGNLRYRNSDAKPAVEHCFEIASKWSDMYHLKVIQLIGNQPDAKPILPPLLIHSKTDEVIRPPKESYISLGTHHFVHYVYTEEIAGHILAFIENE